MTFECQSAGNCGGEDRGYGHLPGNIQIGKHPRQDGKEQTHRDGDHVGHRVLILGRRLTATTEPRRAYFNTPSVPVVVRRHRSVESVVVILADAATLPASCTSRRGEV